MVRALLLALLASLVSLTPGCVITDSNINVHTYLTDNQLKAVRKKMTDSNIYSVFDRKANAFMQPFHSHNHATATRMFESAIHDPSHIFSKHAQDYALYHLATWDQYTGKITGDNPLHICDAFDLVVIQEDQTFE